MEPLPSRPVLGGRRRDEGRKGFKILDPSQLGKTNFPDRSNIFQNSLLNDPSNQILVVPPQVRLIKRLSKEWGLDTIKSGQNVRTQEPRKKTVHSGCLS